MTYGLGSSLSMTTGSFGSSNVNSTMNVTANGLLVAVVGFPSTSNSVTSITVNTEAMSLGAAFNTTGGGTNTRIEIWTHVPAVTKSNASVAAAFASSQSYIDFAMHGFTSSLVGTYPWSVSLLDSGSQGGSTTAGSFPTFLPPSSPAILVGAFGSDSTGESSTVSAPFSYMQGSSLRVSLAYYLGATGAETLTWALASSANNIGQLGLYASTNPPSARAANRIYTQAVRRSYTYFKDVVFDRTPKGLLVPKVA